MHCPTWGPFDHHLLLHPTLTRTYRWSVSAFTLASVALAPAINRRNAFNRAEVAFRQGDWATAIRRFRVFTYGPPDRQPEQGDKTDWVGLAWLRIGQRQALLGDAAMARTSLARAVAADGTIGALASAFRDSLGPANFATRAFAAMQGSAEALQLQDGTASNLGPVVDPNALLYSGGAARGAEGAGTSRS